MKQREQQTPTQRTSLTPHMIIEAAIALADREGSGGVTIRRVATDLGVTPMALYWHVRNKDELLSGMADWVYGAMDLTRAETGSWLDRLRALVEAEIVVLRQHPAIAPLMMTHSSMGENVLQVMEIALDVLRTGGFSSSEATEIVRYAEQTVVNLVVREPRAASTLAPEELTERERQALLHLRSLPAQTYPNVIAAAEPLSRCEDPDQYYAFGLELLFTGIDAMADTRR